MKTKISKRKYITRWVNVRGFISSEHRHVGVYGTREKARIFGKLEITGMPCLSIAAPIRIPLGYGLKGKVGK